MALNSTGPISLGGATTGQSINLELGLSATATISLNDTTVRSLLGVSSGAISLNSAYSKSHGVPITVTARFNSVATTGTIWVAVGEAGMIYRSTDKGASWFRQSDGGWGVELKNVVYGAGGNFIAVGDNGFVLYSPDGITWTKNTNVLATPATVYSADVTGGVTVISGSSGGPSGSPVFKVLTSSASGAWAPASNTYGLSTGLVGQVYGYSAYHTATKQGQMYQRNQNPTDTGTIATGWSIQGRDITATLYPFNSIAASSNYVYGVGEHPGSVRGAPINGNVYPFNYPGSSVILRKIRCLNKYSNPQFVTVGDSGSLMYWADSIAPTITRNSISSQNLYDIDGSSTWGYVTVGAGGTLLFNTSSYTSTWSAGATYTNT